MSKPACRRPPADLATALAAAEAGGDVEYLKVTARGRFLHADEKLMIDTFDGMAGWRVITPLVSGNGIAVLVDRGIVPDDLRPTDKRAAAAPEAPVEVTGILRRHATARGLFSPDNDPAGNLWYWWDVPAMLAASHIPADVKVAPFVVQALPVDGDRGFPRPQDAQAALRNSHLHYAITWFALAAGLAVIAFLYVRGQWKKPGA